MKAVFAREGFRDLLVGQGVSALGDWMVTVALMTLVLELSGSSTAVAGILVLRLLPAAIAGPLAARAGHRWDRRRTMLAMDMARAAIVVVIPFLRALWWVYLWAFMLEVAGLVFLPARDASIPELVDEEDLPLANGLVLASSYGSIPLGAGAFAAVAALSPGGGGFLGHHVFALVFWVDAVTFLVSFAMIRRLTVLGPTPRSIPSALALGGQLELGPATAVAGASAAMASAAGASVPAGRGFRAALRIPLVRQVVVPTLTIAIGLGTLFSLGVIFVREVLRASDVEFGVLIALFGVGAAVGLGALRIARTPRLAQVRAGVALQGATIATMSAVRNLPLALVGAAGFGGATAYTLSAGMSFLQEELVGEERVLAFTAFHVLIRGGLAASALAAGVAADVVGTVRFPLVGRVHPVRLVLVCAGLLVMFGSRLVQRRGKALA